MALALGRETYSVGGDFKDSRKETGQVLADDPQDFAITFGTGARVVLRNLLGNGGIR